MSATLEDRVTTLEGKMKAMEANPQPGQNDAFSTALIALRQEFQGFSATQRKHGQTLDVHTGKLNGLAGGLTTLEFDLGIVRHELREFREETSGRMERLDGEVAALKGDVGTLKGDVGTLKDDMTEVKGTLAEILDRLPPKAA